MPEMFVFLVLGSLGLAIVAVCWAVHQRSECQHKDGLIAGLVDRATRAESALATERKRIFEGVQAFRRAQRAMDEVIGKLELPPSNGTAAEPQTKQ